MRSRFTTTGTGPTWITGSACSLAKGIRTGLPPALALPFSSHWDVQSPVRPMKAESGVKAEDPSYENSTSGASCTKPETDAAPDMGAPSVTGSGTEAPTSSRRLPRGTFAPWGPT